MGLPEHLTKIQNSGLTIFGGGSPPVAKALSELSQGTKYELEYRIRHHNGSIRWIRDRRFAIRGEDKQVVRTCGVAEDITQRKKS